MDTRLRVLIAPDKFAGTASALEVAQALAAGWLRARPQDDVELLPLSDGGPGFVAAIRRGLPAARVREVVVSDPLGRPTPAQVVIHDRTAFVESAQAAGLHLLAESERDPLRASTAGVGALLLAAARSVPPDGRMVVGLGGSATVDGGLGLMRHLGLVALDRNSQPVPDGASGVCDVYSVTGTPALPAGPEILVASDVTSPLVGPQGAAAVYGPQKGLDRRWIAPVDAGLGRWARVLEAVLATAPADLASTPGSGAAGGMGAALLALGGRVVSGFELVASAVGLEERMREADLVVTGEGRFDRTSLRGKVVGGVLSRAAAVTGADERRGRPGLPVLVVAGQADLASDDLPANLTGASDLAGQRTVVVRSLLARVGGSVPEAMRRTCELLAEEAYEGAGSAGPAGPLRASTRGRGRPMG